MPAARVDGFPLELLGNNVAISPDFDRDRVGAIVLPDPAKEPPRRGTVLAVGPGVVNDAGVLVPTRLSPGDRVLFGAFWGSEFLVDGQPVLIGPEEADSAGGIHAHGLHARIEGGGRSLERPWVPLAGALPVLTAEDVAAMVAADRAAAMTAGVFDFADAVNRPEPDDSPDHAVIR